MARLKVLLVGSESGKTALALRAAYDDWSSSDTFNPTTEDHHYADIQVDEAPVSIEIIDTGDGYIREMLQGGSPASTWLPHADCFCVGFSLTDLDSFEAVPFWVELLRRTVGQHSLPLVLVGLKRDEAETRRMVSEQEGNERASLFDARFVETSAKTGFNARQPFVEAVFALQRTLEDREAQERRAQLTRRKTVAWGLSKAESAPPQVVKPCRKSGFLTKCGGHHKTWKSRLFLLYDDSLSYYKNGKQDPAAPTGTIPLKGSTLALAPDQGKKHCLGLQTSGGEGFDANRRYFVHAKSQAEMEQWKEEIEEVIMSWRVFGVPLQRLGQRPGASPLGVPAVLRKMATFLRGFLDTEGLFRVPGELPEVKALRAVLDVDRANSVEFSDSLDPAVVCTLMKAFFRDLPDSLLTTELYPAFIKAAQEEDASLRSDQTASLVKQLPVVNHTVLQYLLRFLIEVSHQSDVNKMTPANIAIVFGPTLLFETGGEMSLAAITDIKHQVATIRNIMTMYDILFPDPCPDFDKADIAASEVPESKPVLPDPRIPVLDQRVRSNLGLGTVRYIGEVHFADGKWIGIELDEAKGKNDGEVKGTRYFACKEKHGSFQRPEKLELLDAETAELLGQASSKLAEAAADWQKASVGEGDDGDNEVQFSSSSSDAGGPVDVPELDDLVLETGEFDTPQSKKDPRVIALPPGWRMVLDQRSSKYYFVNMQTGESRWKPPPKEPEVPLIDPMLMSVGEW